MQNQLLQNISNSNCAQVCADTNWPRRKVDSELKRWRKEVKSEDNFSSLVLRDAMLHYKTHLSSTNQCMGVDYSKALDDIIDYTDKLKTAPHNIYTPDINLGDTVYYVGNRGGWVDIWPATVIKVYKSRATEEITAAGNKIIIPGFELKVEIDCGSYYHSGTWDPDFINVETFHKRGDPAYYIWHRMEDTGMPVAVFNKLVSEYNLTCPN